MNDIGIAFLGKFKTVQNRVWVTGHLASTDGIVSQSNTVVTLISRLASSWKVEFISVIIYDALLMSHLQIMSDTIRHVFFYVTVLICFNLQVFFTWTFLQKKDS